MMIELLPCPFCGGEAEIERAGTRRQSCIVACTDCGGRLESGEEGEHCGQQWNSRHTPEGWKLVPAKPTDDMIHAGCEATGDCERLGECHLDCHCSPAPKVFRAMLAAAPRPGGE